MSADIIEYGEYRRIVEAVGVTDDITEYDATLLLAARILKLEGKNRHQLVQIKRLRKEIEEWESGALVRGWQKIRVDAVPESSVNTGGAEQGKIEELRCRILELEQINKDLMTIIDDFTESEAESTKEIEELEAENEKYGQQIDGNFYYIKKADDKIEELKAVLAEVKRVTGFREAKHG